MTGWPPLRQLADRVQDMEAELGAVELPPAGDVQCSCTALALQRLSSYT